MFRYLHILGLSIFMYFHTTGQSLDAFRAGLDDGENIASYGYILEAEKSASIVMPQNVWLSKDFVAYNLWDGKPSADNTYWLKIMMTNKDPKETNWVFEFDLGITDLTAHVKRVDGQIDIHRSGYFVPGVDRTFRPTQKANIIKVNIQHDEMIEMLIGINSERQTIPPVFDIAVQNSEAYFSQLYGSKQGNTLYIGFIIMMLIFNLFLFSFHADKANIFYSAYLFFLALFTSYNTGDLADWMQDIITPNHPQYLYFFKLVSYLSLICYLAFIRFFLDLKKLLPVWNGRIKMLIYLAGFFIVLDTILMYSSNFSPNVADFATFGYAILFVGFTTAMVSALWKTTDQKKYFIIFGVLALNIGILLSAMSRIQGIDFTTLPIKIGSLIEIVCFSLGLVYRQQELKVKGEKAQFELEKSQIIQAQEQEESKRLKELDEFKSNVYANLTHEFKTPLTVIMGMADRLDNYDKERQIIKRNSGELLELINELLDLSKAKSNQLTVNPVRGDLVQYVTYLFESVLSSAEQKNITLRLKSDRKELITEYDESIIKHIVNNLLSNAIKFTHTGGHVELNLSQVEDSVIIMVKDDGIGIPAEDLDKVFDRFYQSPTGINNNARGVGIGLALVKELVERLNGSITVESKMNMGTSFQVVLPITTQYEITHITTQRDNTTLINQALNQPVVDNDNEKQVVLLIEDNLDVMQYIESCLKDQFQIIQAHDGSEGLALAKDTIPDLIVSDLMMPVMNGVDLCHAVKVNKKTSHIPVILLTAKTDRDTKLEALKIGADAYINKPFDKEELIIRIKQLINMRAELQRKYSQEEFEKLDQIDPFLAELNAYIIENMSDSDLSVESIQKWANLGKSQLYRKIKGVTNLSANQYLSKVRLDEGRKMLTNSKKTISEISFEIGYSDPSYFSRRFSQQFSMTPKQFRDTSK